MELRNNTHPLKMIEVSIVLFWALWWSIVSLSDSVNFLEVIQLTPTDWSFDSGNYNLVVKLLSIYHIEYPMLAKCLYFIIIILSILIACQFFRALYYRTKKTEKYLYFVYLGFFATIAMTGFFILIDEIFINYEFAHSHVDRLAFMLITFITFLKVREHKQS